VIFSSIIGFTASIAGLIAAFSPDTLNLGKKSFSNLTVQIDNDEGIELLDNFLSLQKGNIVKLDVSVCATQKNKCPIITAEGAQLTAKYSNDNADFCDGEKNKYLEGITFYFDESDSKYNNWGWEKFEQCQKSDSEGVLRVSGHFLVPDASGFGQGWTEWMLTRIPDKEIKIRSY
jgi:hypothetical protein